MYIIYIENNRKRNTMRYVQLAIHKYDFSNIYSEQGQLCNAGCKFPISIWKV